jgi:hypothetical protein
MRVTTEHVPVCGVRVPLVDQGGAGDAAGSWPEAVTPGRCAGWRGRYGQGVSETTGAAGEQPQITEEQLREYLSQLREVPAEQVAAELLSTTLNAAQAKIGRRDARLLIDLSAAMMDHVRRYVSTELGTQVDHALGQLRLAQVRAESTAPAQGEPNDLTETPPPLAEGGPDAGAGAAPSEAQPPQPPQPSRPSSGLWVPGRDF